MLFSFLLTSELAAAQTLQDRIDYGTDWWFWVDDLPVGTPYPAYVTEEDGETIIQFFAPDAKDTLGEGAWGTVDYNGVDDNGYAVLETINFASGDVFDFELTDDLGFSISWEPVDAVQKYQYKVGFFNPTNYKIW